MDRASFDRIRRNCHRKDKSLSKMQEINLANLLNVESRIISFGGIGLNSSPTEDGHPSGKHQKRASVSRTSMLNQSLTPFQTTNRASRKGVRSKPRSTSVITAHEQNSLILPAKNVPCIMLDLQGSEHTDSIRGGIPLDLQEKMDVASAKVKRHESLQNLVIANPTAGPFCGNDALWEQIKGLEEQNLALIFFVRDIISQLGIKCDSILRGAENVHIVLQKAFSRVMKKIGLAVDLTNLETLDRLESALDYAEIEEMQLQSQLHSKEILQNVEDLNASLHDIRKRIGHIEGTPCTSTIAARLRAEDKNTKKIGRLQNQVSELQLCLDSILQNQLPKENNSNVAVRQTALIRDYEIRLTNKTNEADYLRKQLKRIADEKESLSVKTELLQRKFFTELDQTSTQTCETDLSKLAFEDIEEQLAKTKIKLALTLEDKTRLAEELVVKEELVKEYSQKSLTLIGQLREISLQGQAMKDQVVGLQLKTDLLTNGLTAKEVELESMRVKAIKLR